jgi:hypothetical protein
MGTRIETLGPRAASGGPHGPGASPGRRTLVDIAQGDLLRAQTGQIRLAAHVRCLLRPLRTDALGRPLQSVATPAHALRLKYHLPEIASTNARRCEQDPRCFPIH